MHSLNADLHCHSNVSDGTLSPEDLAQRAHRNGVELWSLTDHDEVRGQERARASAHSLGMNYLSGSEISVTFAGETVHIVGLGFDPTHAELTQGLVATRGGREQRARNMAADLERAGVPGAFEGALKYVGNPDLISRTHFARYMVEIGICKELSDVFKRYLTEGKPGYVAHRWASLSDAVRWITQAGGVAVVAHPGRYDFTPNEEFALFTQFKSLGGLGVEVVTGSHTVPEYQKYADLACEFDLLASRGSDFHAPGESATDLGTLPPLPKRVTPVWEALAHRIQRP
ncbi:MAG: PHP domain-containing protein [Aquabacterium sp.]|jgi:predicted metal-dependent phosphoesterase TrpH|uniref:3',5'-nucleoside bisphosphate phosphatase n=1 Tax=Aquabacterium sp. TaxID=1872578 RepID=UPI001B6B55A8|nr:3',5'-nucleoside bisphosphate phosphatase [Aquabacterium sp.]MBP7132370.1 PHP domain-containing protein [Aquabacterium sp.]MBP9063338.1 PHP domain-containing protein [Aquabacterium sp.]MDQ5926399.1 3,5-nucleoside bisphosphate phosphatase [Pseudomonadota bacterium]